MTLHLADLLTAKDPKPGATDKQPKRSDAAAREGVAFGDVLAGPAKSAAEPNLRPPAEAESLVRGIADPELPLPAHPPQLSNVARTGATAEMASAEPEVARPARDLPGPETPQSAQAPHHREVRTPGAVTGEAAKAASVEAKPAKRTPDLSGAEAARLAQTVHWSETSKPGTEIDDTQATPSAETKSGSPAPDLPEPQAQQPVLTIHRRDARTERPAAEIRTAVKVESSSPDPTDTPQHTAETDVGARNRDGAASATVAEHGAAAASVAETVNRRSEPHSMSPEIAEKQDHPLPAPADPDRPDRMPVQAEAAGNAPRPANETSERVVLSKPEAESRDTVARTAWHSTEVETQTSPPSTKAVFGATPPAAKSPPPADSPNYDAWASEVSAQSRLNVADVSAPEHRTPSASRTPDAAEPEPITSVSGTAPKDRSPVRGDAETAFPAEPNPENRATDAGDSGTRVADTGDTGIRTVSRDPAIETNEDPFPSEPTTREREPSAPRQAPPAESPNYDAWVAEASGRRDPSAADTSNPEPLASGALHVPDAPEPKHVTAAPEMAPTERPTAHGDSGSVLRAGSNFERRDTDAVSTGIRNAARDPEAGAYSAPPPNEPATPPPPTAKSAPPKDSPNYDAWAAEVSERSGPSAVDPSAREHGAALPEAAPKDSRLSSRDDADRPLDTEPKSEERNAGSADTSHDMEIGTLTASSPSQPVAPPPGVAGSAPPLNSPNYEPWAAETSAQPAPRGMESVPERLAPIAPSVSGGVASTQIYSAAAPVYTDTINVTPLASEPEVAAATLLSEADAPAPAPAAEPRAAVRDIAPAPAVPPQPAASPAAGADLVRQVAMAIHNGKSESRIELRLDPPELGRVDIDLVFADDRLGVVVRAEREEALDLMRRHAEDLARALKDAGLEFDTLEFAQRDGQNGQRGREATIAFPAAPDGTTATGLAGAPHARMGDDTRLDLRV